MSESSAVPAPGGPAPDTPDPLLWDRVTTVLRDWILDGRLHPGDRLVERTIAEELGVSRLPVRDAINILKGEGLLTSRPRQGVTVRRITHREVVEIFEVRLALEVLAARLAADRARPEDVAELRALVVSARTSLEAGETVTLDHANNAIHDKIVEIADNDVLSTVLAPLKGRLGWLLRQNGRPELIHAEHGEICEAIASHDVELAGELAVRHVETSRAVAMAVLSDLAG